MNVKWILLAFLFILILDGVAGLYYVSRERISVTSNPIPQETVRKAKNYTSDKMKVLLNTYIVFLIYLVVVYYFSPPPTSASFSLMSFVTTASLVIAGGYILTLPSRFLSHRIDIRYGISLLSTDKWFLDRLKEFFFLELFSAVFFLLIGYFRHRILLLVGAGFIFILLLNMLTPLLVNVFIKGEKVSQDRISSLLKNMGEKFGIPIDGYYILKTEERSRKLNAMVAGLGPTLRVMIYDRLLKEFSPNEVLSVVAHEFYHWKEKHVIKGFLISYLLFIIFVFFLFRIYPLLSWTEEFSHIRSVSFILLFALVFSILLSPFTSTISRIMERSADEFSIKEAGAEPFIGAEVKLVERNLVDPSPHPLLEFFFYDHPSAIKRINMAEETK